MTQNNAEKIHVFPESKKEAKELPPSSSPKDIFSSKRHSMNYVTVEGVKLRTGYDSIKDWYFLVGLKELLDNPVDFLQDKYKGANDAAIDVYIEKTNNSLLRLKIKNTNPHNVEAFTLEKLNLIFDYDMTAGSKQNLHIISRGILGDAMKQVLALPYVLIHAHDDGTTFANNQWEHPLIIRSNYKEFQVFLNVDLASQTISPDIKENPDAKIATPDTEIEVTLPIIDEVKRYLDIQALAQYCKEYPIFTTDISFKFKLIDNSPEPPRDKLSYDTETKEFTTELVNVLTSPARKAAIKIEYPSLHPIAEKWNNRPSIHSYKQGEFVAFIEGVHNKANVTVYDRIHLLNEASIMKKTPDLDVSIADFVADVKNKYKRMEKLYLQLKATLSAPEKLSLPYPGGEQRKAALTKRIAQLYHGKLNTKAAFYKAFDGFYRNDVVAYPFVFEIIAIPYSDESINNDEWIKSIFKGSVNYSASPRGNIFEGDYEWEDPKKTTEFNSPAANDAPGILGVYSFKFYKYSDARTKLPSIIFANLVTPRPIWHGADKSRIDTTPFAETIIKACRKVADNIQTFKAAGYTFETKHNRTFTPVREKKRKIDDIINELFDQWDGGN